MYDNYEEHNKPYAPEDNDEAAKGATEDFN